MKKLFALVLAVFLAPTIALAWQHGHQEHSNQTSHQHGSHSGNSGGSSGGGNNSGKPPVTTSSPSPTPPPVTPPPPPTPSPVPPLVSGGTTLLTYVTNYGFPDNSCANDGTDRVVAGDCTSINNIDGHAGGDGTYTNPITVAVGYVGSTADYAPGTIFYRADLRKYGVAGDTCAECHSQLNGAKVHLDWWAGGTAANSNTPSDPLLACEDKLTLNENIIINPANNLPVNAGPIWSQSTGCAPTF